MIWRALAATLGVLILAAILYDIGEQHYQTCVIERVAVGPDVQTFQEKYGIDTTPAPLRVVSVHGCSRWP